MTSRICSSVELLRKSNVFPSGRQLERTPPASKVSRTLLLDSTPMDDVIKSRPNLKAGQSPNHQLDSTFEMLEIREKNTPPNREMSPAYNLVIPQDKMESCVEYSREDPNLLIRGMVGYQWTPADLNFIKTMKEEKKVKRLQEELEEKRKLLKNEIQARDLSYAFSMEMQDNLNKLLPCEQLLELGKEFLSRKGSMADMNDLDPKSRFAQIKTTDVEIVLQEERSEITELEEKLTKALERRAKEELIEAENLEQRTFEKQTRISWLMKELSILQSQLEETEKTTHTFKAEVNILKALENPEAKGNVVNQEVLQVTPVTRKVPQRNKKKVDEQSRSKVLQVTQIKQKASEGPKPSGNEPNANSQEVLQISTNHVKTLKGFRQTKNKTVEAYSLRDKSKLDSLKGPKTVKYEESGEIAHASTTQGSTSKIPKNNKKRGEQSTSGVVSQTVKTTRSTFKGPESTEDGGKGNSQVTLQGTQSTTKAAKVSEKKKKTTLSEGLQASTKPKVQAPKVATGMKRTQGVAKAAALKSSQKIASKVTTVQDVQSRSNTVHFEESTVHLQSQEIVQLSISPAKTSKVLRKTRKADGGSKPPEASQASTKPKVQVPKAATGMKGAAGLVPADGVRRSKRIASKITTVK